MITILSPAKTLDFTTDYNCSHYSIPHFMSDSKYLINELKEYDSESLSNLMSLSGQGRPLKLLVLWYIVRSNKSPRMVLINGR